MNRAPSARVMVVTRMRPCVLTGGGSATRTVHAGQPRRACSTPHAQRMKRASSSERGSGSRRSQSKTFVNQCESVIGEDIGAEGGMRELHVAAEDAVTTLGAAEHRGVRRMRAADGMNEEERREEHHRERVEVGLARERRGAREIDAVEARIEEALVRDDARESCELHRIGVDEPRRTGRPERRVVSTTLPSLRSPMTTLLRVELATSCARARGTWRGRRRCSCRSIAPLALAEAVDVDGAVERAHRDSRRRALACPCRARGGRRRAAGGRGNAASFCRRASVIAKKILMARSPERKTRPSPPTPRRSRSSRRTRVLAARGRWCSCEASRRGPRDRGVVGERAAVGEDDELLAEEGRVLRVARVGGELGERVAHEREERRPSRPRRRPPRRPPRKWMRGASAAPRSPYATYGGAFGGPGSRTVTVSSTTTRPSPMPKTIVASRVTTAARKPKSSASSTRAAAIASGADRGCARGASRRTRSSLGDRRGARALRLRAGGRPPADERREPARAEPRSDLARASARAAVGHDRARRRRSVAHQRKPVLPVALCAAVVAAGDRSRGKRRSDPERVIKTLY